VGLNGGVTEPAKKAGEDRIELIRFERPQLSNRPYVRIRCYVLDQECARLQERDVDGNLVEAAVSASSPPQGRAPMTAASTVLENSGRETTSFAPLPRSIRITPPPPKAQSGISLVHRPAFTPEVATPTLTHRVPISASRLGSGHVSISHSVRPHPSSCGSQALFKPTRHCLPPVGYGLPSRCTAPMQPSPGWISASLSDHAKELRSPTFPRDAISLTSAWSTLEEDGSRVAKS